MHDLSSLQKFCSSRFGWPAAKTLEVAQELYDGQGKKIITYPRAEVRYLPESLIKDVPRIVAGLRVGISFSAIPVPEPLVIRKLHQKLAEPGGRNRVRSSRITTLSPLGPAPRRLR